MAKHKKRFGIKGQLTVDAKKSPGIGDLTLTVARMSTEVLRKGSNFKKKVLGPYEIGLEFDIDWDETDEVFMAIKTAFESGDDASVLIEITDGTAKTFTGTFVVEKFDQNQPSADLMIASVGLALDANDEQDPVLGAGTTTG